MKGGPPGSAEVSPIHRLDPRARLLCTLLFILNVNLVPEGSWFLFTVWSGLLVAGIGVSRIGFGSVLRRSLLAGPFLLTLAAVPFVTPGPELWDIPVLGWTVTETGLVRFASLLARFALSVGAASLLVLSTDPPSLFSALRKLGVPAILLSVVSLAWRYLSVIPEEARRMARARRARSVHLAAGPSILWQARVSGNMVGSLFLRTVDRSERVFGSMLSRGFDGTFRSLDRGKLKGIDWAVLASAAVVTLLSLAGRTIR